MEVRLISSPERKVTPDCITNKRASDGELHFGRCSLARSSFFRQHVCESAGRRWFNAFVSVNRRCKSLVANYQLLDRPMTQSTVDFIGNEEKNMFASTMHASDAPDSRAGQWRQSGIQKPSPNFIDRRIRCVPKKRTTLTIVGAKCIVDVKVIAAITDFIFVPGVAFGESTFSH